MKTTLALTVALALFIRTLVYAVVDRFASGGLWGTCKLGWGRSVACRSRIMNLVPLKARSAMNSTER
jgi:hypothetical protein